MNDGVAACSCFSRRVCRPRSCPMMIRHTVRKAFTLLEVLIVVIVIGILAAL
ncbi:MAG: prepilin-type N-terminal cleavage/methylation domain-containing protein, partial [Planctomycetes bacterium]|nr:prepilin-type N-terminal cleavage/methylation domain-containing protein [Planctomycetota bacterium]